MVFVMFVSFLFLAAAAWWADANTPTPLPVRNHGLRMWAVRIDDKSLSTRLWVQSVAMCPHVPTAARYVPLRGLPWAGTHRYSHGEEQEQEQAFPRRVQWYQPTSRLYRSSVLPWSSLGRTLPWGNSGSAFPWGSHGAQSTARLPFAYKSCLAYNRRTK